MIRTLFLIGCLTALGGLAGLAYGCVQLSGPVAGHVDGTVVAVTEDVSLGYRTDREVQIMVGGTRTVNNAAAFSRIFRVDDPAMFERLKALPPGTSVRIHHRSSGMRGPHRLTAFEVLDPVLPK